MKLGILGRKLGMTQIFTDNKNVEPVTVVEATPNVILRVKSPESDGYHALKLGFGDVKPSRQSRPDAGQYKHLESGPRRVIRELRLDAAPGDELAEGNEITVEVFSVGDKVDVTGTSKGRGYAGVMKRHGFKGALATHGTHEFFRHGGAIGMNMTPGKVHKGMKMPGQMGNKRRTTQNLTVVKVDVEKNLLFVRGAIPGAKQGLVLVRHAVKKG